MSTNNNPIRDLTEFVTKLDSFYYRQEYSSIIDMCESLDFYEYEYNPDILYIAYRYVFCKITLFDFANVYQLIVYVKSWPNDNAKAIYYVLMINLLVKISNYDCDTAIDKYLQKIEILVVDDYKINIAILLTKTWYRMCEVRDMFTKNIMIQELKEKIIELIPPQELPGHIEGPSPFFKNLLDNLDFMNSDDKITLIKSYSNQFSDDNILKKFNVNMNLCNYISAKEDLCNIFENVSRANVDYMRFQNMLIDTIINRLPVSSEFSTRLLDRLDAWLDVLKDYKQFDLPRQIKKVHILNSLAIRIKDFDNDNSKTIIQEADSICQLLPSSTLLDKLKRRTKQNVMVVFKKHDELLLFLEENNIENPSPRSILDMLIMYSNKKNYEKFIYYYDKYSDLLAHTMKHSPYYIRLIIIRIKYLIETHQIQTIKQLTRELEITVDTKLEQNCIDQLEKIKQNINLLTQFVLLNGFNIVDDYDIKGDTKGLKNQDDVLMCPICWLEVKSESITLIECNSCNKYVGHFLCVSKWLTKNKRCPYCNTNNV